MVNHAADREGDLVLAAQRPFVTLHACGNGSELLLSGRQKFAALAGALVGKQRIAAGHETLARIVGRTDLGEILRVEQRHLEVLRLGQATDRRCPQRGDPVKARRLDALLKARGGQHATIADQYHPLKVEAFLELGHLARHRRRIAGIAFEHFDRDRAALRRA